MVEIESMDHDSCKTTQYFRPHIEADNELFDWIFRCY